MGAVAVVARQVYLALVEGHMATEQAECTLAIADDPSHDFKMMAGTVHPFPPRAGSPPSAASGLIGLAAQEAVPGRSAQTTVRRLALGQYAGQVSLTD